MVSSRTGCDEPILRQNETRGTAGDGRLICTQLTQGEEYTDPGQDYCEERYRPLFHVVVERLVLVHDVHGKQLERRISNNLESAVFDVSKI